jgi:1-acyl-sn-glycerol-3-phosphate acyltransferase
MIDFSKIDRFSIPYDIYNRYLRFTHNYIYYKKVTIVGKENIPPRGVPTFVISNHQNGLMDALAILYLFPDKRQPVFISRGDIFKRDFVARLLRFLKMMPTFRSRDGNLSDVRSNSLTFDIAANVLKRGGTIIMFPEAAHQEGRYLGTFKKGYPRVALAAEEYADFKLGLQILPLNIHYSDYYNFRGELLITVGKPFRINQFEKIYKTEPNQAYLEMNDLSRQKVKELAVDEDPEFFHEYDSLRNMLHKSRVAAKGKNPHDIYELKKEDMLIVEGLDKMKTENSGQFAELMSLVKEYENGLKTLKLRDWLINKKISLCSLLAKTFGFALAFPFYLFGLVNNFLPFYFPEILKKKMDDRQLHASYNYPPSVVLTFPLMYIIILILAWAVLGKFWIALVYLIAAFLSLFVFYACKKGFLKLKGAWRCYNMKCQGNKLLQELMIIKNKILELVISL